MKGSERRRCVLCKKKVIKYERRVLNGFIIKPLVVCLKCLQLPLMK